MANQKQFTQSKLAGFFFASETGKPIKNLPLFGEVSLVVSEIPFAVDFPKRRNDITFKPMAAVVLLAPFPVQQNLLNYLALKLPFLISKDTYENEKNNIDTPLWKVILKLLEEVKNGDFEIDGQPEPHKSEKLIGHFKELANQHGLPIDEQAVKNKTFSYPLGFLSTDHVGYFSFDLSRVPKDYVDNFGIDSKSISQINQYSFYIYPFGKEELKIDVLSENRFSPDAIVTKQSLSESQLWNLERVRLASIQTPNILDWYLSPGSFAQSPELLLDEDGTEKMLPSNLSLHEFNFHQLVRFSNSNKAKSESEKSIAFPNPIINASIPNFIRFGGLDTYKSSWHNLGHSLGQILYSQPLAPGESIKLTVVDYTFTDNSKREEDTKFSEKLLHEQHRDRTISETVTAAVNEMQKGSSTMMGAGISAGGASSSGNASNESNSNKDTKGNIIGGIAKTAVSGLAGALGINASIGRTTSKSEGHRDTKAETVQKLMDNFSQASSAQRELKSSVVVETKQEQKETIQTRTITNYNHSHTLTILYYEVLRHFRVTTEYVRTRPVLFIKMKEFPLNERGILRKYKNVFEQNLLEERHKAGFAALEKIIHREAMLIGLPQFNQADREFRYFTFEIKTGGIFAKPRERIEVRAMLSGSPIKLVGKIADNFTFGEDLNPHGAFREPNSKNIFDAKLINDQIVRWNDTSGIIVWIHPLAEEEDNPDVGISYIKIIAKDVNGFDEVLFERDYNEGHIILDRLDRGLLLPFKRPPLFGVKTPEQAEDEFNYNELITHLTLNQAYYNAVLNLSQNKFELSNEFENIEFIDDKKLIDVINLEPIDVMGNYIAYPCTDDAIIKIVQNQMQKDTEEGNIMEERLMTLPTKGIFAEGKLGHANLSEEIDNTRYWKWEEHPIPFAAPDIAPAIPITPSPVSNNLNPSPFPNSLVNIVNPPSAPDPTGMQQAMSLLGKGDIFRDMSGRAETGALLSKLSGDLNGLLGKLSDNSIKSEDAAVKLKEIIEQADAKKKELENQAIKFEADKATAEAAKSKAELDSQHAWLDKKEKELELEKLKIENEDRKLKTGGNHFTPKQNKILREDSVKKLTNNNNEADLIPNDKTILSFVLHVKGKANLNGKGTVLVYDDINNKSLEKQFSDITNGHFRIELPVRIRKGTLTISLTINYMSLDEAVSEHLITGKHTVMGHTFFGTKAFDGDKGFVSLICCPEYNKKEYTSSSKEGALSKWLGQVGLSIENMISITGEHGGETSKESGMEEKWFVEYIQPDKQGLVPLTIDNGS